ncbi:MAG: hypothetical protein MMC23_008634 [Stictis urceolatum]|nr:hypothetical protein [Stictis urceolata]
MASGNGPIGRTDLDGDSQMHSSSSESEMFPEEATPTTPQQFRAHLQEQNLAAISPPGSQGPSQPTRPDIVMDNGDYPSASTMARNGGDQTSSMSVGPGSSMSSEQMSLTGGKLIDSKAPDQNAPGWGWQQPKAREEYERSYAHVLDRDFSLREFGELIDEQDIVKNTGLKI